MVSGYERIEGRLKGKRHAVGERITAVDFNLYIFWFWGLEMGLDMEGRFPSYRNVVRGLEALDGVKETARSDGWEV
jgi:glutathione S-transferase